MKHAGFDSLSSRALEKPVYLWLNECEAELRDASSLWGKTPGN
jgi:aldehyde:ferredoxin oxidoreductase